MCVRRSAAQIIREINEPEEKLPTKCIMRSKADVSDALRDAGIDPDEAHNFCFTLGQLIVIVLRLTFGGQGPRFSGA